MQAERPVARQTSSDEGTDVERHQLPVGLFDPSVESQHHRQQEADDRHHRIEGQDDGRTEQGDLEETEADLSMRRLNHGQPSSIDQRPVVYSQTN